MENLLELLIIGGICGAVGYFIVLTETGRQIIVGFTGILCIVAIIWIAWFFITEGDSSDKNKIIKKDTLSLNQVKRVSTTFLNCRGNYAETSYASNQPYRRISESEMSNPNIEVAYNNDNKIFMRTKYVDGTNNSFESGILLPQERIGKLVGIFMREPLLADTFGNSTIYLTITQNNIALHVSDIRLNPDFFRNSYYSCYEV